MGDKPEPPNHDWKKPVFKEERGGLSDKQPLDRPKPTPKPDDNKTRG